MERSEGDIRSRPPLRPGRYHPVGTREHEEAAPGFLDEHRDPAEILNEALVHRGVRIRSGPERLRGRLTALRRSCIVHSCLF